MALRTLILVCSAIVPGARPLDRDATPAPTGDVPACKASDVSPAEGSSRPSAAGCDEALWSSPLLAELDEGDTEDFFQALALATWRAGARDLAICRMCPTHSAPLAAHFWNGHIPLRC
jgi:hypothetical protein